MRDLDRTLLACVLQAGVRSSGSLTVCTTHGALALTPTYGRFRPSVGCTARCEHTQLRLPLLFPDAVWSEEALLSAWVMRLPRKRRAVIYADLYGATGTSGGVAFPACLVFTYTLTNRERAQYRAYLAARLHRLIEGVFHEANRASQSRRPRFRFTDERLVAERAKRALRAQRRNARLVADQTTSTTTSTSTRSPHHTARASAPDAVADPVGSRSLISFPTPASPPNRNNNDQHAA